MAKGLLDFDPQEQAYKMMEIMYDKWGFWTTLRVVIGLWIGKSILRKQARAYRVTKRLEGAKRG